MTIAAYLQQPRLPLVQSGKTTPSGVGGDGIWVTGPVLEGRIGLAEALLIEWMRARQDVESRAGGYPHGWGVLPRE